MFVSQRIEVACDSQGRPLTLKWSENEIEVVKIINSWQDWGFAKGVKKKNWRARRHRNYFQLACNDGRVYEVYLDRQDLENKTWYLYRVFDQAEFTAEDI